MLVKLAGNEGEGRGRGGGGLHSHLENTVSQLVVAIHDKKCNRDKCSVDFGLSQYWDGVPGH